MSKQLTEREVDLAPDEEASRPSLSDFLSVGLRQSQRPQPPERAASEQEDGLPAQRTAPEATSEIAAHAASDPMEAESNLVTAADPVSAERESHERAAAGDSPGSELGEDHAAPAAVT